MKYKFAFSTNPDTFVTAEKTVLETYVRQVDKLVHLTINGEKIPAYSGSAYYVVNGNTPFFTSDEITDKGYYNASTKKFTPREGVTDIPEDYVKNIRAYVSNCKTYSKNVSSSDYFAKLPDIVR